MFTSLKQVLQKPSVEARQQLTILSRQVANAVSEIVHAAEAIKGIDSNFIHFVRFFQICLQCQSQERELAFISDKD